MLSQRKIVGDGLPDKPSQCLKIMHRTHLFLLRVGLGLWGALVVAFLSLLCLNAPNVPHYTPFASVAIAPPNQSQIYLPNRTFTCSETGAQFQCRTQLQDQWLELNLTRGNGEENALISCRATYNRHPINCQGTGMTYAPILAENYEISGLELSESQFKTIQRNYWGINTLIRWGEWRLMGIGMVLSLFAGLGMIIFAWNNLGKLSQGISGFTCGLGMTMLIWSSLAKIPYDTAISYGISPDILNWLVQGGAIAGGIVTILAFVFLMRKRLTRIPRLLMSTGVCVGLFCLCTLLFQWLSLFLQALFGLGTVFLSPGSSLTGIASAVSIMVVALASILLFLRTDRSLKSFLSLGSGIGTVTCVMYFFMFTLFGMGYVD
jgi:hypothetical protein